MSLYGLTRHFYAYVSDDGNTYQVALTDDDAFAGSFGGSVPAGTNPVFPRGWRMRKQYGISSGGVRTKVPVSTPTVTQWITPSTFTKKSVVFTAEGSIGERRTTKS